MFVSEEKRQRGWENQKVGRNFLMNNSGIYVRTIIDCTFECVIYNVIISSSKPPSLGVFNVSFRWLYMSYIPWYFQPISGAEFGHLPSSISRRGTTGASVEHGVIGIAVPWNHRNLRADPPSCQPLGLRPRPREKKVPQRGNYDKLYTMSFFQKKSKTATLSTHLGHSP